MFGNAAIYMAFFTALAAGVMFALSSSRQKVPGKSAVYVYYAHTAAVIAASLYLLYLILTHQFQYLYVYAHTDLSLDFKYLLSAFWAGQEGSYLFWSLCGALIGLILLKTEQKMQAPVMTVYMAGQAFLLLFTIMDSPFALMTSLPVDGAGLNPLLMDPWMVIHPPIVFAGYALLLIPFAYAVAALYCRDYQDGFLRALPWAVAGWLFLGAGIFIGGVWAYRVLGWGGYWGWDPVENSSLVPWLIATALVHGLLRQRQRRAFVRFNFFLAFLTFLLVIFATFLTRSGVMANYSVHAFAETSLTYILAAFMLSFTGAALTLFAWRYRDLSSGDHFSVSLGSRPGSFGLTMIVLCVLAALILLGTLSPFLTGLAGPPSAVDSSFYYKVTAPLAFALLVLAGLCALLRWKKEEPQELLRVMRLPLAAALVAALISMFAGVRAPLDFFFLAAGAFALTANVVVFWRVWRRRGLKFSGGYLAHVGLALMLAGILVSTNYTHSHLVELPFDRPVALFNHSFTYQGYVPEGEKFALNVQVDGEDRSRIARPKMYVAGEQMMREPAILRNLWRDIYISPQELASEGQENEFNLTKGEAIEYEDYRIVFQEFTFLQPHGDEADTIEIGAVLEVTIAGEMETVIPILKAVDGQYFAEGAALPGSSVEIFLNAVDASQGLASFSIGAESSGGVEILIAEIQVKPFISVLALGTILLVAGTALAAWRRFGNLEQK